MQKNVATPTEQFITAVYLRDALYMSDKALAFIENSEGQPWNPLSLAMNVCDTIYGKNKGHHRLQAVSQRIIYLKSKIDPKIFNKIELALAA